MKFKRHQKSHWRRFIVIGLAIAFSLLIIFRHVPVDAKFLIPIGLNNATFPTLLVKGYGVHTSLEMLPKSPPNPPILGGTGVQSPPELGDLGGETTSNVSEEDLCVHDRVKEGAIPENVSSLNHIGTALRFSLESSNSLVTAELSSSALPEPQAHPLPETLAQWQDTTRTGDYFAQVKPTSVGYLVWSQFPVKVYVEQLPDRAETSPASQRFQNWVEAVVQAVQEWNVYLPLQVVAQPEAADISILRSRPPLQAALNRETGQLNLPRARSAETNYEFYLRSPSDAPNTKAVLSQRFTIHLSPDQTVDYTLATARHELGHALGIWGHSPLETDTMYFSQVRHPPQISARDINTLKRIYEQPTRVGWSLVLQSRSKK